MSINIDEFRCFNPSLLVDRVRSVTYFVFVSPFHGFNPSLLVDRVRSGPVCGGKIIPYKFQSQFVSGQGQKIQGTHRTDERGMFQSQFVSGQGQKRIKEVKPRFERAFQSQFVSGQGQKNALVANYQQIVYVSILVCQWIGLEAF